MKGLDEWYVLLLTLLMLREDDPLPLFILDL